MFHISLKTYKGRAPAVQGIVPNGAAFFATADAAINSTPSGSVPDGTDWFTQSNSAVVPTVTYANSVN